jgi:hypothetical protein
VDHEGVNLLMLQVSYESMPERMEGLALVNTTLLFIDMKPPANFLAVTITPLMQLREQAILPLGS